MMANILTCYYRPKPGGFCKRLFRAIDALLAAGHTVHYLSVEPFPIDHVHCHFHRFPWPKEKTDTLLFWAVFYCLSPISLAWLMLRHGITHAFGFSPVYAALLKPASKLKLTRLSCFLRGDILFAHQIKAKPSWIIRLDRLIEGLAVDGGHIVSISRPLLTTVLDRHPEAVPASIGVLPNALPEKGPSINFSICDRDYSKNLLHLAFAGVLAPTKNIGFLFDLMKRLPSEKCKLWVFGSGPLKEDLVKRVRDENLNNNVQFEGWVAPETIWPRVDLLLAPSLCEGMPNAVLEAVANGVAVLASDIPAHREMLPEDQLVVLHRPDQWAKALQRVIDLPDSELSRMRDTQRKLAEKFRFDWDLRVVEAVIGEMPDITL